jgi:hypothetical protein
MGKLAAEGVRFTQAFTTGPVCSASRSAMITGMYQTSIGAHNHRSHRDDGQCHVRGKQWLYDGGIHIPLIVRWPGKLTPVQALFMAPRKPDEELFDLRSDPWEINSLAASPDRQKTLKRMRAILEKWTKDTGDEGQFPEQDSSITPRDRERIRENSKQTALRIGGSVVFPCRMDLLRTRLS